mmetsp:Transcript_37050/g.105925  ORF Transcript_37050/g.105925 Transcript_37050/m.105925 type:complete len:446 (-) Transcript_37050:167-1504(-)
MNSRYQRVRIVGKGSFGCCWLVENEASEQCILKQVDVSKMSTKQTEEAANEVKVLAKLRHPFIINYRESYLVDGLLCIITDYAEKGDLHRVIHRQKRGGRLLEEATVLRWFAQTSLALKHVHDRHIVHRDLKTQNIFLAGPGQGNVKVGDFGIARVLEHTQDCAKTAIGTPYYLSPEICQERPYNHKSDVWSLGCVLHELATLQHAFDADSMRGLVMKILRGEPPQVPASFSSELGALARELLTKDPCSRPSVDEVLRKPVMRTTIRQLLREAEAADPGPAAGRASPRQSPEPKAPRPPPAPRPAEPKQTQATPREPLKGPPGPAPAAAADAPGAGELAAREEPPQRSPRGAEAHNSWHFVTPDGRALDLAVGEGDSLSYRVEALKAYLEQELGLGDFLSIYRHLSGGVRARAGRGPLETVAPRALRFLPLVQQLMACETQCAWH